MPDDFARAFREHLVTWAQLHGLGPLVEARQRRPWVLATEHRTRNLYREEWWRHLKGCEHLWVRALNSSQCFGVNLFAPLADRPFLANRFLQKLLPERRIADGDTVSIAFEHRPRGVAAALGESRQPTQIDVFFTVIRENRVLGAVGVEVKLSESESGSCRGWTGVENPDRSRCSDLPRVLESPATQCFLAEREGRKYWTTIAADGGTFDSGRLSLEACCPFRQGLYQMMRNRVALDVYRSSNNADWCDFVVCVHPANTRVFQLSESVAGKRHAVEAFRALVSTGAVLEWNPARIISDIVAIGEPGADWANWMRDKYLLVTV